MKRFCDEDCNHCPIVTHKNSKQLSYVLNRLLKMFGDDVYTTVQNACPNMTVCYDCRIDDFCHDPDCEIEKQAKAKEKGKINGKLE